MMADELAKLGEPCAKVLAEAGRLRAALAAQREVNHGLVRTLQAYHAEVERLRAALRKALTYGLSPHDVSGKRAWREVRDALAGSPPPA